MRALTVLRWIYRIISILLVTLVLLCFTPLPMQAYKWLGRSGVPASTASPELIVVLGGGGIPSESGLMRTYHGAARALAHPDARVIVSLPADGDPETADVGRMKEEIVLRGVDADRIAFEHRATSTRRQAVEIAALLGDEAATTPVMIVTSEFHIRRAVAAFRKAGVEHLIGYPARDHGLDASVGGWKFFRYNFWVNLECELRLFRELTAMGWYRLRGWM